MHTAQIPAKSRPDHHDSWLWLRTHTGASAWAFCAISAAVIVWRLQVADRSPLVWDEAARVDAGAALAQTIRDGDLLGTWQWIHAQAFYPFVGPALNGLVLFVTNNPLAAAWVPSLAAYALAGILASRLAFDLGAGELGAASAAFMTWSAPILARVAGGAWTEPIGACLILGLVIAIGRFERDSDLRVAAAAGLIAALTWLLKYDYGLVALGTLGLSGLVATAVPGRRRTHLKQYATALVVSFGLILAWLSIDPSRKLAGVTAFVGGQSPGSTNGIDWSYYPLALFREGEVGLNTLIAAFSLLAVLSAVVQVRGRETRAPIICLILWYVMYSIAATRYPRYLGTIIPLVEVFAGLAVGQLVAFVQLQSPQFRRLAPAAVVVVIAGLLALQVGAGATGLRTQFWFLLPNPAASDALAFVSGHLDADEGTVLMLGQTNELSSYALHLAWTERIGRLAPPVVYLGETGIPPTRESLVARITESGARQIVAIDVRPGSRLDTSDYHTTFPSQVYYVALTKDLDTEGSLARVAQLTTEAGHLQVTIWDYVR